MTERVFNVGMLEVAHGFVIAGRAMDPASVFPRIWDLWLHANRNKPQIDKDGFLVNQHGTGSGA